MTGKGEPFFLLTPIRGAVRLHSPFVEAAFSLVFPISPQASLLQEVFPGRLSILCKIHPGQFAECLVLNVVLPFLIVLGRFMLLLMHSLWVVMDASVSLCSSAFLPALRKIIAGNNTAGKPVISFLTMGWAGSELGKEWWLFDPTHTINLIYCKSRTEQNISPLEQEKNQEPTWYVALLSDFVVIPELSPYCILKLTVKMQVASILSHTTGRVYLKQLPHSSELSLPSMPNTTFPYYKSVQEAKAILMRQIRWLKTFNILFLRIWVLIQCHQDVDYKKKKKTNQEKRRVWQNVLSFHETAGSYVYSIVQHTLTGLQMTHWARIKANGFPDTLHRINKHELDKTASFYSHTMK